MRQLRFLLQIFHQIVDDERFTQDERRHKQEADQPNSAARASDKSEHRLKILTFEYIKQSQTKAQNQKNSVKNDFFLIFHAFLPYRAIPSD